MQCKQCGEDNRDSAKFCLGCGTNLAATNLPAPPLTSDSPCPSCNHDNPAGTKFCSKCGFSLLTSVMAPTASSNPTALPATETVTPPPIPSPASVIEPAVTHTEPAPAAPEIILTPTFTASTAENVLPPASPRVVIEPTIPDTEPKPTEPLVVAAPTFTSPTAKQVLPPVPPQTGKNIEPPPYEQKHASNPALKVGLAALLLIALGAGGWWYSQNKTNSSAATDYVRPDVGAVTATMPAETPAVVETAAEATPKAEIAPEVAIEDTAVSTVEAPPSPEEIAQRNAELKIKKEAAEQARKKREAAAIVKRQERQAEEQARAQARANSIRTAPPQNRAIAPASLSEQVAACKQRSFFEREKCMWSLCNNKWGSNGCPAYNNN